MAERTPFELVGPLPEGLTVLEASAGTGKTYALSTLAMRYVVELGVPVSSLCIVSFTEAATAELRSRVRQRLVEVAAALAAVVDGVDADADAGAGDAAPLDEVVRALVDGLDDRERTARLVRAQAAINEFDTATITTIHGFCGRVLAMSGDSPADGPISRSSTDVDEAVHDLLLACAGPGGDDVVAGVSGLELIEAVAPSTLADGVRTRLRLPDAVMWRTPEPDVAPVPDLEHLSAKQRTAAEKERVRLDNERNAIRLANAGSDLVDLAHRTVVERRQHAKRRTLDRVVVDARDLVQDPASAGLVAVLRQRFRVVLIDEFQDTDRVQWDLFRHTFVGGPDAPAVVLVGDPKQSIYRFRGAELEAYLDAVAHADAVHTLQRNWRSDAPVLRGLECLLSGVTFGADDVEFHPVEPAPGREAWRLRASEPVVAAPVELRLVPRQADDTLTAPAARTAITADVVRTIAGLLDGRAQVAGDADTAAVLRARDIAVLTRSNADATNVVAALAAAGIAAASSGATSVTATDAWNEWRCLFAALERPGSSAAVRAAAVGWFGGLDLAALSVLDDLAVAALHERFRSWAALVATRGIPALLAAARADGLQRRLLARHGGERDLTDLEHIAELLQGATGGRPTPASTLRRLIDEPGAFGDPDDVESLTTRRIDRDDDAVQVLTAHRSKGLEFAVVLCPFLWSAGSPNRGIEHADLGGRRTISPATVIGAAPAALADLDAACEIERDGEQRRLIYVALTRARHSCIVWWAPLADRFTSVLGDILGSAAGLDRRPTELDDLRSIADRSAGSVAVSEISGAAAPRRAADLGAASLEVATTDRVLDTAWRIWSFSAIKAASEGTEHDRPVVGGADEPAAPADVDDGASPQATAPGPLASAPGGTEFGTLVHQVLEEVDFTSATLRDDLAERCALALRHRTLRIEADELAAGLASAIDAPLGGPLGAQRLADLTAPQRLNELVFDLPLGRLTSATIGAVLVEHLAADDPLLHWAQALAAARSHLDIEGMLTGSIDLVARTADGQGFWVADYKTNQLGIDSAYGMPDLVAAMTHHDYPLQAVLYLVALHRFLRWRLHGYDPARHLLGAAYLFVRGMVPGSVSSGSTLAPGVFWWRPPAAAIIALDRLLAEGAGR